MQRIKLFVLLIVFYAPQIQAEQYEGIKELTLSSGKVIRVIAPMIKMKFIEGGQALRLRYITNIDLSDKQSLKNEAIEIWNTFIVNVEKHGYKTAILAAYAPWEGDFNNTSHKGHMFRLEKQENGKWVYIGENR